MRGEEGNRGMKGGRGEEGSRGHANGKLYCRKTNIESAAGSAEGESSRCLLFILGPTSVAEFLPRYACGYVCGFTSASSPRASVPSSSLSLSTFLLRYGDDRRNSDRADFVFSFERKVRRPGRPGRRVEIQIFVRRDSSDLKF